MLRLYLVTGRRRAALKVIVGLSSLDGNSSFGYDRRDVILGFRIEQSVKESSQGQNILRQNIGLPFSPRKWNQKVGQTHAAISDWVDSPLTGTTLLGLYSFHSAAATVVNVDGSVHFLSKEISPQVLISLTTRSGGETISEQF
jgi:hypothetical protein